jgi:hypothetical protein
MGTLILDIDYIQEWICGENGKCQFRLAPADLVFYEVSDLTVSLDYSSQSIAIGPFSIQEIHREIFEYQNGFKTYLWQIDLNFPRGSLGFKASGFWQRLKGSLVLSDQQYLSAQERRHS